MKKTFLLLLALGLLSMSVVACAGTGIGGYITPATEGPDDNGDDMISDEDKDECPDENSNENPDDVLENDGSDFICDAEIVLPGEGEQSNAELMRPEYLFVTGTVKSIEVISRLATHVHIEDANGNPAVLVIAGNTVIMFADTFNVGDVVTGWYLSDMPMILIYPPQYTVAALAVNKPDDFVVRVDRFFEWEDNIEIDNSSEGYLISQDRMFAFRTDENTEIVMTTGDVLTRDDLAGFRLIVQYNTSTRSIPEMATAYKVIRLFESIVPL